MIARVLLVALACATSRRSALPPPPEWQPIVRNLTRAEFWQFCEPIPSPTAVSTIDRWSPSGLADADMDAHGHRSSISSLFAIHAIRQPTCGMCSRKCAGRRRSPHASTSMPHRAGVCCGWLVRGTWRHSGRGTHLRLHAPAFGRSAKGDQHPRGFDRVAHPSTVDCSGLRRRGDCRTGRAQVVSKSACRFFYFESHCRCSDARAEVL